MAQLNPSPVNWLPFHNLPRSCVICPCRRSRTPPGFINFIITMGPWQSASPPHTTTTMATLSQFLLLFPVFLTVNLVMKKLALRKRMKGYKLPPSRPGYPLLGNVLEVPTLNESQVYDKWAKELNTDILYVNAAGTPIVVVNDYDKAIEMLEGRSSIYSSRPGLTMINDLMDYGWLIPMLPYGNKWKERRKLFQKYLSPAAAKSYVPAYVEEQVGNMIIKLLDNPKEFELHGRHAIGAISISMAYGLPMKPSNDPYINAAEDFIFRATEAGQPGAFYVDFLPFLRHVPEWVPGAGFQTKAREWKAVMKVARDKTFNDSENRINSGIASTSFVSKALENLNSSAPDVDQVRQAIMDTAGVIFTGATDTTSSTVGTFFLAMMKYPEVQKRAQEQLDKVLGGRIPEYQDELDGKLPYITAIVKEVLRWVPVAPISFPHQSQQDDIFHDYFIPKGSIIIPNCNVFLGDPEVYPKPKDFIPERFLDKKGEIDPSVRDPSTVAFGFGRRICPGAHIARSVMFLMFASVLSQFDISKPIGEDGKPIEPSMEYGPGILARPLPFKCDVKPRSKKAVEAIQALRESKTQF